MRQTRSLPDTRHSCLAIRTTNDMTSYDCTFDALTCLRSPLEVGSGLPSLNDPVSKALTRVYRELQVPVTKDWSARSPHRLSSTIPATGY